jgi:acyl-CoA thioesterase
MKFSQLMNSFERDGAGFRVTVTDNWLQGRTTYGGMSAALCLEGALRAFPDLPPLRSAQVSFLGPVGGAAEVRAEALRRGKNVSFVSADLFSGGAHATRAVFAFGAPRETVLSADFIPARKFPPPEELKAPRREGAPPFALEFDVRWLAGGKPFSGSRDCDVFLWLKHADVAARSAPALLALADMPPPALFPMFPHFAPLSTMTWSLNFLADPARVGGDWLLMECRAENAGEGYSSQDMFIWTREGRCIAAGRQSVAIFV